MESERVQWDRANSFIFYNKLKEKNEYYIYFLFSLLFVKYN